MEFDNGVNGIFFATNSYGANSNPEFELVFENGNLRYTGGELRLNDEVIEKDYLLDDDFVKGIELL